MNKNNLSKMAMDYFNPVSEKTFSSYDDMVSELSNLWSKWSKEQSDTFLQLSKGLNVLYLGIKTDFVPDKNAFFLLRLLKLAPPKIVYRFDYDSVSESLSCLFQNAERIDKNLQSKDDIITSLQEDLSELKAGQVVSHPLIDSGTVPITKFYRLAGSYQRMLMHADDVQDEVTASAIRKDVKAALRGQGMLVVDYDGTNEQYFNVVEDDDCNDVVMTCPAIISKDGEKVIAKGNLFKHS